METEIVSEFLPFGRIYKDGRVERLTGTEIIPSSLDATNDVVSKDVVYSPEHNLSVRLFLPHNNNNNKKLPLLIYIHGGAWIIESPFSPLYHNHVAELAKSANCLAVSVQYRRAPEHPIRAGPRKGPHQVGAPFKCFEIIPTSPALHPIPAAYEDSWSAIEWIFSHAGGSGPEEWINEHAYFERVFIGGDSAGANMSHHMAMRAGREKLEPRIKGVVIVHPAFWGTDPVDELDVQDAETRRGIAQVWEEIASPNSVNGTDDPLFNVVGSGSDFSGLGCEKVLVAVAGKDVFVRQGLGYAEKLKKSGWGGDVEVVVEEEEGHVFHLQNPDSESALRFLDRFVEFITDGSNGDDDL